MTVAPPFFLVVVAILVTFLLATLLLGLLLSWLGKRHYTFRVTRPVRTSYLVLIVAYLAYIAFAILREIVLGYLPNSFIKNVTPPYLLVFAIIATTFFYHHLEDDIYKFRRLMTAAGITLGYVFFYLVLIYTPFLLMTLSQK
ncbi:hypothetical protein ABMA57_11875 [Saccharospirillum sp. HFRX-1]|uniref:hypothetical protein n=1 Tax=unclassified Saccharospirillum TaxID=2633430 RepID=UPI0037127380